MDVCDLLNNFDKIQELICGKNEERKQLLEERERLIALATDISAKMPDGMPFTDTGTVSKKMENAVLAKVIVDNSINDIDHAITQYIAIKKTVIKALEQLPAKQYAVCHRYFIRHMTYEQIAEDLNCSTVTVWRIKEKAMENLKEFFECN